MDLKMFSLVVLSVILKQSELILSLDITTSLGKPPTAPIGSNGKTADEIVKLTGDVGNTDDGAIGAQPGDTSDRTGLGFDTQFFNNFNFPNNIGLGSNTGYGLNSNCPMQTDILDSLRLSDSPTGYPVDAIAAELALRPEFTGFLVDQAVLPGSDPIIPEAPRFLTANSTCPSIRRQLWSVFINNNLCWVLQNFNPQILYAECLFKTCQFCSNPFGFHTQNQCLKQYEFVSAYVYCPAIGFPRIIPERFIIPRYCTCKVVNCQQQSTHLGFWKK